MSTQITTLPSLPCDLIKHIVHMSNDQMQTMQLEASSGPGDDIESFGSFKGVVVRQGVFVCTSEDEEWLDKHILIDDDYDEEALEYEYAFSGEFDWSTLFRSTDGRIFVFGTCETEGFNEWNGSFRLHCIGRLVRCEMSVGPFSDTLGRSFARSRRNKHTFRVELYEGVFIAQTSENHTRHTRFVEQPFC